MNLVLVLAAGGAIGAISGAVTGCEVSALVENHDVLCAPTGAFVGTILGAVFAGMAAPSARLSSLSARRAVVAATLILGLVVVGSVAFAIEWFNSEPGGDQIVLFAIGLGVVPAAIIATAIAVGILKRRPWACWAGIVSFSLAVPAAAAALAANVESGASPVAPAIFLVLSIGIVALLSLPSSDRRQDADRGQVSSSGR